MLKQLQLLSERVRLPQFASITRGAGTRLPGADVSAHLRVIPSAQYPHCRLLSTHRTAVGSRKSAMPSGDRRGSRDGYNARRTRSTDYKPSADGSEQHAPDGDPRYTSQGSDRIGPRRGSSRSAERFNGGVNGHGRPSSRRDVGSTGSLPDGPGRWGGDGSDIRAEVERSSRRSQAYPRTASSRIAPRHSARGSEAKPSLRPQRSAALVPPVSSIQSAFKQLIPAASHLFGKLHAYGYHQPTPIQRHAIPHLQQFPSQFDVVLHDTTGAV